MKKKKILLEYLDIWRKDKELSKIKVNLSGINLSGVVLQFVDLSNVDLSGANLTNTEFFKSKFLNADLSKANLLEAHLYDTVLIDANLTGASLIRVDLSNSDLTGANFSGADLSSVDLLDSKLQDANLTDANLEGANLEYANLKNIKNNNKLEDIISYIIEEYNSIEQFFENISVKNDTKTLKTLIKSTNLEIAIKGQTGGVDSYVVEFAKLLNKAIAKSQNMDLTNQNTSWQNKLESKVEHKNRSL